METPEAMSSKLSANVAEEASREGEGEKEGEGGREEATDGRCSDQSGEVSWLHGQGLVGQELQSASQSWRAVRFGVGCT